MKKINRAISKGLVFLSNSQMTDGSFSSSAVLNERKKDSPNIFSTPLILTALASLRSSFKLNKKFIKMCTRATNFLAKEISADGTFNYWKKESINRKTTPYPNDLDDTALALGSIYIHSPDIFTGQILAQFVKTLSKYELKVGGPYNTWCIDWKKDRRWRDCDLAVNANIAYALSLFNIELPKLHSYLEKEIRRGKLISSYYISPITMLYFISRSYKGTLNLHAIKQLEALKKNGNWKTPLMTALALSALSRFGADLKKHSTAISFLLKTQNKSGGWNANNFYIEQVTKEGTWHYQSEAWTTAAVLEALSLYQNTQETRNNYEKERARVLKGVSRKLEQSGRSWKAKSQEYLKYICDSSAGRDAMILPFIFHDALCPRKKISRKVLGELAKTHTIGWMAYTLLDRIIDDEIDTAYLPLMSSCMREFSNTYRALLPDKAYEYLSKILTTGEEAQYKERQNILQKVSGRFSIKKLPDNKDIPTYEKSIGHSLPALTILFLTGEKINGARVNATLGFFRNFLAARQLNDDAHDVVEDLSRGVVTLPGKLTLTRFKKKFPNKKYINLAKDKDKIIDIFWGKPFDELHAIMMRHLNTTERMLDKIKLKDRSYFQNIISKLKEVQTKGMRERNLTRDFIKSY